MKYLTCGRGKLVRRQLGIASVLVGLAAISGCALSNPTTAFHQVGKPPGTQAASAAPAATCGKPAGNRYVGISVAGTGLIGPTEQAMGITANVISLYYAIGQPINMQTVGSLCSQHKLPVIDIQDEKHSLAQIASGADDQALTSYALGLGTLQAPVAVDFDHEFNGPWFSWGYKNVTPAEFVAAWRHVVTIFRDNGATNVIWIWNPNVTTRWTDPDLQAWYPGDDYVSWVGLDGYFYATTDTYSTVFTPTISQVHAFTKRPVFIVETGASPPSGRARAIASIFQGVAKTPGMLGLIYFDFDKTSVHNWYINNDPPALAAFKAGASSYLGATG